MGGRIGIDLVPPIPNVITLDPAPNVPITVESAVLGFHYSSLNA